MIPAESPPIREALYVVQDYLNSEYYRDRKPNGAPYQAVDCASGKTYHCGYDEQGAENEPLLAMADGNAFHIDKGPAYGIQTALVPSGTDYAWFYAHQNRRSVSDGQSVKAGQHIGDMGTTGRVQRHLHLGALEPRSRDCWFNPGPALRALKAQLLNPPTVEDEMFIFKKASVSSLWSFVSAGVRGEVTPYQYKELGSPKPHVLPDDHPFFSFKVIDPAKVGK